MNITPEPLPSEFLNKRRREAALRTRAYYNRRELVRTEFHKRGVDEVPDWVLDAAMKCQVNEWSAASIVDKWLDGSAVER